MANIDGDDYNRFFIYLYVVLLIFMITLHTSIYMWIDKLEIETCRCSELWQRDVLKYLIIFIFLLMVVNMYIVNKNKFNPVKINKSRSDDMFHKVVYILGSMTGIAYIYLLFTYIYELYKIECECSEDWRRDFGWYYSIVVISIYALILFWLVIMGIFMLYTFLNKK